MAEFKKFAFFVGIVAMVFIISALVYAQAPLPANPFVSLTRLSDREYVDLSRVRYVRLPTYLPPVPGCLDCQLRWGASLRIEGVDGDIAFTEDAEAKLKELLRSAK
jgi:hypothetical protein